MKFKDLKAGERAVVVGVTGDGPVRKRLLDLGLTRGVEIVLVRVAPLGDPIEIELRGFRLTVRKDETDIVELERCEVRE
ncbi:MAG: ferrous iron transport protein A [archaeon]|nr:ferrous iron transport protein A [archaeon]